MPFSLIICKFSNLQRIDQYCAGPFFGVIKRSSRLFVAENHTAVAGEFFLPAGVFLPADMNSIAIADYFYMLV